LGQMTGSKKKLGHKGLGHERGEGVREKTLSQKKKKSGGTGKAGRSIEAKKKINF